MKYTFTRVVARVEIAFGVLVIFAGAAFAVAMLMLPASFFGPSPVPVANELLARGVIAVAVFLVGLGIGASCIVAGQITLVFLDIARRVARMDRRQRRRADDSPPDESRWIDRLRQR